MLKFKKALRIGVKDMNYEQCTSLMVTTRMVTTNELTYSMSRVIEVTALQSVDAICYWIVCHC